MFSGSAPSQRRAVHLPAEHAVEVGKVIEARILGNVSDGFFGAGEFAAGVGDADFGQEGDEGSTGAAFEMAGEGGAGDGNRSEHVREFQRFVKVGGNQGDGSGDGTFVGVAGFR